MRKFITAAGVLVALALVAAIPALAQEEPETGLDDGPPIVGTITSISGDVILVEENPSVSVFEASPLLSGGDKGYFTVTGETGIFGLLGGDAEVPISFDDLETGQLVAATYEGSVVAESYTTQGIAGSIVVLSEFPGDADAASFMQYDNAG
ncbi:MAG: YobA family protein [Actinomycetota bacterium]|nr:YobA family protein [Actinomycetota bacterium]